MDIREVMVVGWVDIREVMVVGWVDIGEVMVVGRFDGGLDSLLRHTDCLKRSTELCGRRGTQLG